MASKKKKRAKKEEKPADSFPSEEMVRGNKLKCLKRWMIHGDPGQYNGWLIIGMSESVAAGW